MKKINVTNEAEKIQQGSDDLKKVAIYLSQNPAAIKEARGAINDILQCSTADETTKVEALKALNTLCTVSNNTISNCSISQ